MEAPAAIWASWLARSVAACASVPARVRYPRWWKLRPKARIISRPNAEILTLSGLENCWRIPLAASAVAARA